jgi:hypothetical protein
MTANDNARRPFQVIAHALADAGQAFVARLPWALSIGNGLAGLAHNGSKPSAQAVRAAVQHHVRLGMVLGDGTVEAMVAAVVAAWERAEAARSEKK